MSGANIAYDLRLAELLDKIKTQMWIEEELQIQPKDKRRTLFESYRTLYEEDFKELLP